MILLCGVCTQYLKPETWNLKWASTSETVACAAVLNKYYLLYQFIGLPKTLIADSEWIESSGMWPSSELS